MAPQHPILWVWTVQSAAESAGSASVEASTAGFESPSAGALSWTVASALVAGTALSVSPREDASPGGCSASGFPVAPADPQDRASRRAGRKQRWEGAGA